MSLENVESIQIVDVSPDKSFVPYSGLERLGARALARDFARLQEDIFTEAAKIIGKDEFSRSADGIWTYSEDSNFELISGPKFGLNHSRDGFAESIALKLGVFTSYFLSVKDRGGLYFFDINGNFGKVRALDNFEPDCIVARDNPRGLLYYKKEQMQAGHFELVGYALSRMWDGFKPKASE